MFTVLSQRASTKTSNKTALKNSVSKLQDNNTMSHLQRAIIIN